MGKWTDEIQIGWQEYIWKTVKEFKIQPGYPVFSILPFVHSDLIIYLDIDAGLLTERAKKRNQIPEFVLYIISYYEFHKNFSTSSSIGA